MNNFLNERLRQCLAGDDREVFAHSEVRGIMELVATAMDAAGSAGLRPWPSDAAAYDRARAAAIVVFDALRPPSAPTGADDTANQPQDLARAVAHQIIRDVIEFKELTAAKSLDAGLQQRVDRLRERLGPLLLDRLKPATGPAEKVAASVREIAIPVFESER